MQQFKQCRQVDEMNLQMMISWFSFVMLSDRLYACAILYASVFTALQSLCHLSLWYYTDKYFYSTFTFASGLCSSHFYSFGRQGNIQLGFNLTKDTRRRFQRLLPQVRIYATLVFLKIYMTKTFTSENTVITNSWAKRLASIIKYALPTVTVIWVDV